MNRRAPEAGYNFGNKRQYRRNVWATFRGIVRETDGLSVAETKCLLMPSAEGDEIDVALANGFRQPNLYVVDSNPAIVAHLKRRYPYVHTYGVDVALAAERIARSGVTLNVANLDLTGCISKPLLETVERFVASGVLHQKSLLGITVLRGRERPEMTQSMRRLAEELLERTDDSRDNQRHTALAFVIGAAGHSTEEDWKGGPRYTVIPVRRGRYASSAGTQSMSWIIFDVHRLPCSCLCCTDPKAALAAARLQQ